MWTFAAGESLGQREAVVARKNMAKFRVFDASVKNGHIYYSLADVQHASAHSKATGNTSG